MASAFVTQTVVTDILGEAVKAKAKIKFLTGTFGNNTRKSTFQELLEMKSRKEAKVRIWSCGLHRNFHAKLYIWKLPESRVVVWIGSANFTDGGLQREGELLLELRGSESSPAIKKLKAAFGFEWKRGAPITRNFVDGYREAPRPAPDMHPVKAGSRLTEKGSPVFSGRLFTTHVSRYFEKDSRVAREVIDLLPGTAGDNWYRSSFKKLRKARKGDYCLLIDVVGKAKVALVQVTDTGRSGKRFIFAYDLITQWQPWTQEMRARLEAAGLRGKGRALGVKWIDSDVAKAVVQVIS